MRVQKTEIDGLLILEPEKSTGDPRGWMTDLYREPDFKKEGLEFPKEQVALVSNKRAGTLRGMHFQKSPFTEIKFVQCLSGMIFDVVVDLRAESATYTKWLFFYLNGSDQNCPGLYIPRECAHGYLTLLDNTKVMYQISDPYHKELQAGIRFDDPTVGIVWPNWSDFKYIMSDRDRNLPYLKDLE